MTMMFRGQFKHAIDAKGRTSLPSRFREQLASEGDGRLVLTPALFEPCIDVFPYQAWQEFEQRGLHGRVRRLSSEIQRLFHHFEKARSERLETQRFEALGIDLA